MKIICVIDEHRIVETNIDRDLIFRSGATNVIELVFIDRDGFRLNITGWTITLIIREMFSTSEDIINMDAVEFVEPLLGEARIELTPEDSDGIVGNFIYQLNALSDIDQDYVVSEGMCCFKSKMS